MPETYVHVQDKNREISPKNREISHMMATPEKNEAINKCVLAV